MGNSYKIVWPLVLSLIAYFLGVFYIDRQDTVLLLPWFAFLFAGYWLTFQSIEHRNDIKIALWFAAAFRLVMLIGLPALSDDFYRFIWDGRLINHGINPFVMTPETIMAGSPDEAGVDQTLYDLLNSPYYHTIYPPIHQLVFFLATLIFPTSIAGATLFMKLVLFGAELYAIQLISRLLKSYKLPSKNVLIYALNPLVIVEVVGNLHFEGLMLMFLFLAIIRLKKGDFYKSVGLYGLSISTKLLPMMGYILLFKRLRIDRALIYIAISGILTLFLFSFFLSKSFIAGFYSSFALYFKKFEFNASLYYLVREVGYITNGYNTINTVGPWMGIAAMGLMILYAFYENKKKVRFPVALMVIWSIYLLFSTTVHPWYVIPLVGFCLFSKYRYPVVWSFLITMTYANYRFPEYHEIMPIVIFEYGLLALFVYWELNKFEFSLKGKLSKAE